MAGLFARTPPTDLTAVAIARLARLGDPGGGAEGSQRGGQDGALADAAWPAGPAEVGGAGWVPDVAALPGATAAPDAFGGWAEGLAADVVAGESGGWAEDPVPRSVSRGAEELAPPPGWLPGMVAVPAQPAAVPPARARDGLVAAVRGALVDRLPPSVRSGRLALGGHAVGALALVAVLAALLAGWLLLRSRPVSVSAPARVPITRPSATPSPTPSSVVIDVAGKVGHPGLVTLPAGSRVADAIGAAGGALPGANLGLLNLASKLGDGQQVLVDVAAPAGAAPPGQPGSGAGGETVLDLNAATPAQLEQLPGVGPVLAQRIADWRTQHGGFARVDQLRDISGIGDRKFAELRAKVRV